jgi:chemotaxis protein MotB
MARKVRHEEHENLERWLVSYADFITLLFAFFVVMYSISSVNEGKYRVLSDSITKAFSGQSGAKPIKLGDPVKPPIANVVNAEAVNRPASSGGLQQAPWRVDQPADVAAQAAAQAAAEQQAEELNQVADQVDAGLKELIDKGLVSVNRDKDWIEVEMNTNILFGSGSAELQPAALPVLRKLGGILGTTKYNIQVEGFTDNVPINTEVYPSNWELSAARAATVVRVFTDAEVQPQRLVALGFGEFRPAADNATEEGRSKNRRVKVVILPPGQDARDTKTQARMFETTPAPPDDRSGPPADPGPDFGQ